MKKNKTGDKYAQKNKAVQNLMGKEKNSRNTWLIGIDEVGRGPLAGPVTVGAVGILIKGEKQKLNSSSAILKAHATAYSQLRKKLIEISEEVGGEIGSKREYPIGIDSKKMKEKDRDFWYEAILKLAKKGDIYAIVSSAPAEMIDKRGIAVCIKDLVDINIKKISNKIKETSTDAGGDQTGCEQMHVLLDGGLKTNLPVASQKTIIKGDEKELLISLASVFAKVTRDRCMKSLSKNPQYALYKFDIHKGYGTVTHRSTIKKHGMSDVHRKSFCKNVFL